MTYMARCHHTLTASSPHSSRAEDHSRSDSTHLAISWTIHMCIGFDI